MNKKKIIIISIIPIVIITILGFIFLPKIHQKHLEEKIRREEEERIRNATIIVNLKEDLTIPFYSEYHVSDFIESINGELIDDYKIDTTKVGNQKIKFEYINEEDIKIPYSFNLTIKDETPPLVWLNSTYTVYNTYEGNIAEDIFCADNYDDHPTCEILGDYNQNEVGDYPLQFKATDESGNTTLKDFTLRVREPVKNNNSSSNTSTNKPKPKTEFNYIVENYKNENTKIGIDVSGWQGEIDYEKVRDAGVEFVFIKVGGTKGIGGDYYVDSKFIRNIEGFNKVGIPVGVYIFSYVKAKEQAIADANWVLEQIKDYDVELPVVYDWENWSDFKEFESSFFTLTSNAKTFLDIVSDAGYKGALYGSKNYLEQIWLTLDEYETWLAHYNSKTTYSKDFTYWQICDNGRIDGINADVDIDIMFINK